MPTIFPDEIEVQVIQRSGAASVVAAIELISPRNNDRPDARRAFAVKWVALLKQGIAMLIVDVGTKQRANLHDELIHLLAQTEANQLTGNALLYSVCHRPLRTEPGGDQIVIRPIALAVGQPVPTMPLALRDATIVPVDLELTYTRTRQRTMV